MMTITTWTRVWCRLKSCMMTMRIASVLSKFRKSCHYEVLVIKDGAEGSILFVKD